jgi:hypothetical protein
MDLQVSQTANPNSLNRSLRFKVGLIILFLLVIAGAYWGISKTLQINNAKSETSSAKVNNSDRKSDLANLSKALKMYAASHNGSYPQGITSTPQKITKKGADICQDLVPRYMYVLPIDPSVKKKGEGSRQTDCHSSYDTGYVVVKNANGTITLSAPLAELNGKISVTQ